MGYKLTIDVYFDSGDGLELKQTVIEADSAQDLIIPILNAIYDGIPFDSIHLERIN